MSKKKRIQRNQQYPPSEEQKSSRSQIEKSVKFKNVFWGIFLFVVFAQLMFTLSSMGQIRYEELAESIRNPFWLEHKTLYDGVSSNIGWYGTLLAIYKTFGFSINSAKFFRLFLEICALLSIALILRRYLNYKQSIVPLLAYGLSPTILYITTMQHSHGIDLQYAPIVLYFALSISNDKNTGLLFKSALLWSMAMVAWMSYPTFVFYLIPLLIVYLWQLKQASQYNSSGNIFCSFFVSFSAFLLPLIIALSYLKDMQLAIYDSITKSGIFRGAGTFNFEFSLFFTNILGVFNDLFYKGQSYHFELFEGDFSNYYPVITIIVIFGLGFSLLSSKKLRIYLFAVFLLIFSNLILSSFTLDPSYQPGIRRTTGTLFGIYALFTIAWVYTMKHNFMNKNTQLVLIVLLLLIPLHQIIVYPQNLARLSLPSTYAEGQWFKVAKTPNESLNIMIKNVIQDELKLGCKDPTGESFTYCRYSEVYAAVAGYCTWNNVDCHMISGYDIQTGQQLPLSVDLWESYQLQH